MSATTAPPEAAATPAAATPATPTTPTTPEATPDAASSETLGSMLKEQELSIRALLEAGVHYGHQPGR
ncbi:MAG: hypothetical protein AB8G23_24290, partial [Myxococcota bacterium]